MSDLFNPWLDHRVKDSRLGTYYSKRVVDQAPIDSKAGATFLASALPGWRVRWLGWIMVGVCLLLIVRIFWLQVILGTTYRNAADHNRVTVTTIPAARGIIYDRNNVALVKNDPNFVASVVPTDLKDDAVIVELAEALELDSATVTQQVNEYRELYYGQPLVLKEFITHAQALKLMAQFHNQPGVHITAKAARSYTQPEIFANILGYLGRLSPNDLETTDLSIYDLSDHVGKTGLEATYEANLRGTKGAITKETTAGGKQLDTIAELPAVAGSNLVLTIDAELQTLLYNALRDVVERDHLSGASAVALDPRTGQVRALVTYPSYDPNLFIQGITNDTYQALLNDERKPLFNKPISGEYPSGSTFKLVVAAAALQEGVVTDRTTVQSTGGLCVNCSTVPDFPDWKSGGHGVTNVYKALAESVNTFFYIAGGGTYDRETREISGGLGIERIQTYARLFGLDETSGIALPAEATGFVPSPEWKQTVKGEDWYLGDTYHVSIGQGDLLVTPLQVALFTAVVANGGTLYEPQLVDHLTDQSSTTTEIVEPVVRREGFIDAQHLAVVRAGMRQAVTEGSARSMSSLAVTSAGKTGTAETGIGEGKHSWYTTFLPYQDPTLVLTVMVENGGEGSATALPIAKSVLSAYSRITE